MYAKLDPILHMVLRAAILVGLVFLCVPWSPWMPSAGLDASWVFVLHHAFAEGWQWGKDIVFTFGPLGFMYAGMYHPATYPIMLLGQLILVSSVACAVFAHARHIPKSLLVFAGPGLFISMVFSYDLMLLAVPLILVFFATGPIRRGRVFSILFSGLCAYVSLVKFTAFMLAVPLVILSDLYAYKKRGEGPYHTIIFIVILLLLNFAARQEIGYFPTFLVGSYQVASGYSTAMQLFGPSYEIVLFLAFGAIFVTWYGWALWSSDKFLTALRLVAILLFGFMIFKASFTRHDGHAMIGFGGMFLGVFMLSGWFFSGASAGKRNIPAYASIVGCFCYTTVGLALHFSAPGIIDQLRLITDVTVSTFTKNAESIVRTAFLEQDKDLAAQYTSALAAIRTAHPLPAIKGTVDIYSHEQAAALAHGLELRSRPIFQSYSVYSAPLIDKNVQFLEGDSAPSRILFHTSTIDERFPNLDDGGSWLTLAKWYGFDSLAHGFAVLERLDTPRSVELVELFKGQMRIGEPTQIPAYDKNLWVSIKFKNTLVGDLTKSLFKLPKVTMRLDYSNSSSSTYRIIPDMTNRGFLLDPLIQSGEDFALMLSGKNAGGPKIRDMEINTNPWMKWLFADALDVEFSELRIDQLKTENTRIAAYPGLTQLPIFKQLIVGAESLEPIPVGLPAPKR
jgi:hypothetical protein